MLKLNQSRGRVMILAAAVATFALSRASFAQYAAPGQDGHANDASNQVGSGGVNIPRTGSAVTQNDIVNHNVTNGREFHTNNVDRDPRAFSGPTGGNITDIFTRQSSGVPTNGATQSEYGQATPYYGDSRFTAPPPGALPNGFSNGYIGTVPNTSSSLSNGLNVSQVTGLQARADSPDTLALNASLNPSALYGQGANPNYGQMGLLGTESLYGRAGNAPNNANGLPPNGTPMSLIPQLPDTFGSDDASILRMRQELRDAVQGEATPNAGLKPGQLPTTGTPGSQTPDQAPVGLNQPLNQPLGDPIEAPSSAVLSNTLGSPQNLNTAVSSTGILPANIGKANGLVPAEDQSPLLRTLKDRLAKSSALGKDLVDAQQATQTRIPVKQSRVKTPNDITVNPDQPVMVKDLAKGIKAQGLHDLLTSAETLIQEGKYDSAILKYNQAQRVAPNNPLPVVGRAQAELAGGYYARAEMDLRMVLRSDQELLLAQFDLKSLFPKDRIDYVRNDLQNLAQADPKAERPWFLLAYLDYNTGNTADAQRELDEAAKRSGTAERLIPAIKRMWSQTPSEQKSKGPAAPLPVTPLPDLNK